jgi:nicotinate-nucleotide adenylyltransferase
MAALSVKTVAIFGGSFNPPHVAHQMACLWVLATQSVDEVWLIPTWRHAFEKQLAPFADRLAMCRLAAAPLGPRVQVSTIEEELAGEHSRTLVTLEALSARHPDVAWRLVIGADILPERGKWYRWEEVERLAPPIVLGRQGYVAPPELGELVELPAISSTLVRARVGAGESIASLVPREVASYLGERGLYRAGS